MTLYLLYLLLPSLEFLRGRDSFFLLFVQFVLRGGGGVLKVRLTTVTAVIFAFFRVFSVWGLRKYLFVFLSAYVRLPFSALCELPHSKGTRVRSPLKLE